MSNYYFLWLCTEQWELIYYVAFIILTIGLVIFTAKTYFFQTKQSTKLFCKSIEKSLAEYQTSEVYIPCVQSGETIYDKQTQNTGRIRVIYTRKRSVVSGKTRGNAAVDIQIH